MNQSPARAIPTSPNSSKSNKLQRLFLRSKGSTPNLQGYNVLPPISTDVNNSPSIRGTRTHEWGTTVSPRNSINSRPNTRESFELSDLNTPLVSGKSVLINPSTDTGSSGIDSHALLPPLESVTEVTLSNHNVSAQNQKTIRRRGKIFTNDELQEPLTLSEGAIISNLSDNIQNNLTLIESLKLDNGFPEEHNIIVNDHEGEENIPDDASISGESEFSFEQDSKAGRNVSIRYYKSPKEEQESSSSSTHQPGFYVDDYIDEDFEDDMNYLDEDDEFNDDEELFNRKYFSDDEDVPKNVPTKLKEAESEPHTPIEQSTGNFHDYVEENNTVTSKDSRKLSFNDHDSNFNALEHSHNGIPLKAKRSLKYYQLPENLDQEYSTKGYTFLNENNSSKSHSRTHSHDDSSYDSLLDEINNVPEDFDFENEHDNNSNQNISQQASFNRGYQPRSKSLKSSLSKITKGTVFENSYQNSKFKTNDKTVTLFNRSRSQNSVKTNQEKKEDNATITTPEKNIYSTPNNSFTSPQPGFIHESNFELSPISERSIDESP